MMQTAGILQVILVAAAGTASGSQTNWRIGQATIDF
jgi:hypothetical protein